ncbi:MAG: polynucleotide adenylyltransferase PcnB [Polyangia bacterium]
MAAIPFESTPGNSGMPVDRIDPDAHKIVVRLARAGFQAYLVGGCVRDLLIGRRPKDFDVCTSATPPEIKQQFRNCRIIGRRFRLAHIFFGQKIIETSTFRSNPKSELIDTDADEGAEEEDTNNLLIRHDNVFGTAEEDARRRDFTVNGLFYDVEADKVIDWVGGLEDLEKRVIRTIGDANIRFREDPIRILRALKFAARIGFDIDPDAYAAILAHRGEIAKCAPPRVLEEVYRLMRGGAARRSLELLDVTGVLGVLSPDLAALIGREGDHEGTARLFGALERLDAHVQEGYVPSNSLLLGLLTAPFVADVLYGQETQNGASIVDEVTQPILDSLKVSRRDLERLRQILVVERRIGPRRKRKGRAAALARREFFPDALMLYELVHGETDQGVSDELQQWRQLMGTAPAPSQGQAPGNPPADGNSDGPNRQRRRRRGGRGRKSPE